MRYHSKNNTIVGSIPGFDLKLGKHGPLVSRNWQRAEIIDFDPKGRGQLRTLTRELLHEDPLSWRYRELNELEEPLRSALHSFLVDLSIWHESTEGLRGRVMDSCFLLDQSINEGPAFADWLDGFRNYAISRKTRRLYVDQHDMTAYMNYSKLVDLISDEEFSVDMLYRPDKLFPWRPPNVDLKEYCSIPVLQKDEILDLFRQECRAHLSEFSDLIPEIKIKEIIKDGSSYCQEGKTWKVDFSPPAKKRDNSRLVHVPASLKKSRPACVETYASALKIRWIDSNVRRLNSYSKRAGINYSSQQIEFLMRKRIRKFKFITKTYHSMRKDERKENARTSYCRDFSKEGITKPRNLLRIMLEEIHNKFPFWESTKEVDFFDKWELLIEDELYYPDRGHGLGMANELTTLMQIVIERVNVRRGAPLPKWSAYLNDDAVTIFDSWAQASAYKEKDFETCNDLGLLLKPKATFLCIGHAVFCEIYSSAYLPKINSKDRYDLQANGQILKACNELHLIDMIRSMDRLPDEHFIREALSFYKFKFLEIMEVPELIGGLRRRKVLNVDASAYGFAGHLSKAERIFYEFEKLNVKPIPWKRFRKAPKSLEFYSKEFLALIGEKLILTEQDMFRPSENPRDELAFWNSMKKEFKKIVRTAPHKKKLDWSEVIHEKIMSRPDLDIITNIGDDVESEYTYYVTEGGVYVSPFEFSRRTADYLYTWKKKRYFVLSDKNTFYLTEKERIRIENEYKARSYTDNPVFYNRLIKPESGLFKTYHDPFLVRMVYDRLKGTPKIYEIPETKSLMIKRRDEFYGELSPIEWINLGKSLPELRLLYPFIDSERILTLSNSLKRVRKLRLSEIFDEYDLYDPVKLLNKVKELLEEKVDKESFTLIEEDIDKDKTNLEIEIQSEEAQAPEESSTGEPIVDEAFIEKIEDDAYEAAFGGNDADEPEDFDEEVSESDEFLDE